MPPNYVKVLLRCRSHKSSADLCVKVERGVPDPLRCTPGGPISGGSSGPPFCRQGNELLTAGRLGEAVNGLVRHGWSDYVRAGVVTIECC
jgi:hypothetical protein